MTAELRLRLLGGLHLALAEAPLTEFVTQKAPALLAYLAITRQPQPREALAALLWGERPDADARNNLRQALSNLRRPLDDYLQIDRDTVGLRPEAPLRVDVAAFEAGLLAAAHPPLTDPQTDHLAEALALYQGDFLAGLTLRDAPVFEEWMLAQRARLRALALHGLHHLTQAEAARGRYPRAIEAAQRQLALEPWREEAHRQLMVLQARTGQRAAALAQYEACRRVLATELAVAPSAETQALYQRLRAAGDAPRHNLPPQPTAFFGRAAELAQLEGRLLQPERRLVTLLGPGGIGKTRLALAAAERLLRLGAFLDGVAFVPLSGVETVAALAPAIAEACGLGLSGPDDPREQVMRLLKPLEVLLVLDGFEHLVEAAAWLGELLQAAPQVKVLVTSRERLNLRWEWVTPVAGLDPATAAALFHERAARVRPDFHAETTALAQLCAQVEGMPLGLELAAAWTQTLTVAEIAAEIERGYAFLATTLRDVPERQRSLQVVFDHSWQRLTVEQRAVCQRLAVFRGGFTRPAAEAGAGASPHTLAALVEHAWLRAEAEGRFDFHALLRQYALERLVEAGEADAARDQHAELQLALAEQAEAEFHSPQQAEWVKRLEAEHPNLRAALGWLAHTVQPERLARLAAALWPFWYLRNYLGEGRQWLERALAQPATPPLRARLLRGAGVLATLQADHARAIALLEENLAYQRGAGAPAALARALNSLAVAFHAQGDYPRAAPLWEECVGLQRAAGDRMGLAQTLQNLSALAVEREDYAAAQAVGAEGLTIFRELGLEWGIAWISINLALAAAHTGQADQARAFATESLQLCLVLGSQDGLAEGLEVLAGVATPEQTAQLLGAAHALREAVGAPRSAGSAAHCERLTQAATARLGAAQFQTAWRAGQALTPAEAVALAARV